MILQALYEYYQRLALESEDYEPEGYKWTDIQYIFVLKKDGYLIGVDDTQEVKGKIKKARKFLVPKVFEGSRTANVKANLLWDKASYIFGTNPKSRPEILAKREIEFKSTIRKYFPESQHDDGVSAVLAFLETNAESAKKSSYWEEIIKNDSNIAFRLDGDINLVCQRNAVKLAIQKNTAENDFESGQCLITGKYAPLATLENPIKKLSGSMAAESHLVSFNAPAYWSYCKVGSANAPISKEASSAYISSISYMRRENSSQHIQVGDATTIFWAAKKNKLEDIFSEFFGNTGKGENASDTESIRALFNSPRAGVPPLTEDLTPFFVLGLSPNASRIAIRFWYAGTVGSVSKNIVQHFDDLEIVKSPHEWQNLRLQNLLRSTAVQEDYTKIPPNLAGEVMKSVLTATPYPLTLLNATIIRIKAEQSKKDKNTGRALTNITYQRAALIKAVLCRDTRYYKRSEKEVDVSLDINNVNPGYRLGRLFAALERAQELVSPNLNATIRDRFYSAASSTPVAAFPQLLKLKNYHLADLGKMNKGAAINLEKLISEIIDGLGDFPTHLSLVDQGRFAIGYYHQRQAFFTKNISLQNKIESE